MTPKNQQHVLAILADPEEGNKLVPFFEKRDWKFAVTGAIRDAVKYFLVHKPKYVLLSIDVRGINGKKIYNLFSNSLNAHVIPICETQKSSSEIYIKKLNPEYNARAPLGGQKLWMVLEKWRKVNEAAEGMSRGDSRQGVAGQAIVSQASGSSSGEASEKQKKIIAQQGDQLEKKVDEFLGPMNPFKKSKNPSRESEMEYVSDHRFDQEVESFLGAKLKKRLSEVEEEPREEVDHQAIESTVDQLLSGLMGPDDHSEMDELDVNEFEVNEPEDSGSEDNGSAEMSPSEDLFPGNVEGVSGQSSDRPDDRSGDHQNTSDNHTVERDGEGAALEEPEPGRFVNSDLASSFSDSSQVQDENDPEMREDYEGAIFGQNKDEPVQERAPESAAVADEPKKYEIHEADLRNQARKKKEPEYIEPEALAQIRKHINLSHDIMTQLQKEEANLLDATGQALMSIVEPVDQVEDFSPVENTQRVGVLPVVIDEVSGYLAVAMGNNELPQDEFMEQLCEAVQEVAKEQWEGKSITFMDPLPSTMDVLDFEQFCHESAEFMISGVYQSEQVIVGFLSDEGTLSETITEVEGPSYPKKPVDLASIVPETPMDFPGFIYLEKNDRYFKYVNKDRYLTKEQISRLTKGNQSRMHINHEDMEKFQSYRAQNIIKEKMNKSKNKESTDTVENLENKKKAS